MSKYIYKSSTLKFREPYVKTVNKTHRCKALEISDRFYYRNRFCGTEKAHY